MKKNLLFLSLITLTTCVAMGSDDVAVTAKNEGCSAFYEAIVASGVYEHAKKSPEDADSLAPFTVFAPSNDAFAAIKDMDPKKQKKLITLHVVPGKKIVSPEEGMKDGVPTVGEKLLFGEGKSVHLDGSEAKATITKGPIEAKNGVLYLIDAVLLPAGESLPKPKVEKTEPKADIETKHTEEVHKEVPKAISVPAPTPAPAPIAAPVITPISEQTAQLLNSNITQLTHSIQLLILTIQQAQQASDASATAKPASVSTKAV